jgi:hypothetical protein
VPPKVGYSTCAQSRARSILRLALRHTGTSHPRALLASLVALAALAVGDTSPALGASFIVDATHDAVDASPGDGTRADATGACTLRRR